MAPPGSVPARLKVCQIAITLLICYAVAGHDICCAATSIGPIRKREKGSFEPGQLRICLRARYTLSGSDLAHPATSLKPEGRTWRT
eukprot:947340-Rhodomonas_salina.2